MVRVALLQSPLQFSLLWLLDSAAAGATCVPVGEVVQGYHVFKEMHEAARRKRKEGTRGMAHRRASELLTPA